MIPSITEAQFNTALGNLLQAMLPQLAGKVAVGQVNRVASPEGDYAVFWPLRRPRLATDADAPADAVFTGTISPIDANTATMDITAVDPAFSGQLQVGSAVFGATVATDTTVTALGSGTGGLGTYIVKPSQTVTSGILAAGAIQTSQDTEVVMQIDVHGPNSGDNAQVISTLFRNQFAVNQLSGTGISPLYADDPRQMAFTTAAQQFEDRWSIDLHLEFAPVIAIPQEFTDSLTLDLVDVDVAFPE